MNRVRAFFLLLMMEIFMIKASITEEIIDYLPETIEAIVGSVDGQNWCPCVRLGHASVSLEDDYLSPDFVVYLIPLVQNFLYVILE